MSNAYTDHHKVAPSYRRNGVYHTHRTSAWQDPTGQSRKSLCGVEIGPVGREITYSALKKSKFRNRVCKKCVNLFNAGGR